MGSGRSDLEKLRLFSQQVDRLVGRRALRDGTISSRWQMKHTAGVSTEFSFDRGDEEDLLAAMTAFRFFTAVKEDTYFPAVCNLLERVLTNLELREANRHNRAAWSRAEKGEMLLQVPGRNLTYRGCYDLWVNGEIFHADESLEALYRGLPEYVAQTVKTNAAAFLIDGARVVFVQRNVVNEHLRQCGVAA